MSESRAGRSVDTELRRAEGGLQENGAEHPQGHHEGIEQVVQMKQR